MVNHASAKMVAKRNVEPGEKFGLLTFVAYEGHCGKNRAARFVCECGAETVVSVTDVKSGHTKSCGCAMPSLVAQRLTRHGHFKNRKQTRAHMAWCNIIARCTNENRDDFERYGGRGIKVCDRWRHSFESFYEDMGDPPVGHSIDRRDNSGDYEKSNCRWATIQEQNSNQRSNVNVTLNGRTQNLKAWSRELDLNYGTLKSRVARGAIDPQKILKRP